ncbi:gluconolaconase [Dactylosporangium sp. AC04546]|uniref:PQQ-dependent sugar dehydrogenase n=1 Tax=Dactylosporangium sp. AC04546 TaxID=2862460 RepID=UPI001EDCC8AF|nr:gluconolaconase [Dactylosporangium sp. AC04546]WVK85190.1 gluconolaconase [Dactylosporangium sp. AC04546]
MRKLWAAVLAGAIALAACTNSDHSEQPPEQATGQPGSPEESPPTRTPVQVPTGLNAAPFDQPRYLDVPAGWTVAVYARIDKARFLALTPSGDLLVSQPSTGKIHIVRAGKVTEFVSGLRQPHDMVFAQLGGKMYLFVAESHRVQRYPYTDGDLKAQPGQVVVDGLPDSSTPELRGSYAHQLKNIAVHGDRLYLSIASTCNACVSDTVSDPRRAAIYTYAAAGTNAERKLLATGIRNAEGLAFRPGTDELWAVVNNRDNTLVPDDRDVDGDGQSDKGKRMAQFVDDYPIEPFIKVRDGGFYGWPFCNPDGKGGFDRDYELNRDGQRADCAKADPIALGLPPHSAPLGLTFYRDGAVVPLHGSWNSTKPAGYKVQFIPFGNGTPGAATDLVTGFVGPDGRWWGRPVDAAADRDGSLLVSDDGSGTVYRLTPSK